MATVGILMPTFERTDYLRTALGSALDQTFDDIAIYVGDNSATDAVERVVAAIDDPRLRYRRNDRNLGVLGNWLALIRDAETPYVATLHDDDVWEPTFLEETVPLLDGHPDVGMVFVDYWIIDQHGARQPAATAAEDERTRRRTLPSGRLELTADEAVRLAVVWNAPQPAYAAVMRRAAALGVEFPDGTDLVADLWLSYTLARSPWRFAHVAERLTNYRHHADSVTARGFRRDEYHALTLMIQHLDGLPIADELRRQRAAFQWLAGRELLAVGDTDGAREQLREARADLDGMRRLAAAAGSRSRVVLHGMHAARALLDPVRRLLRDGRPTAV